MSISTPPQRIGALAETAFTKRVERRVLRFIREKAIFKVGEHILIAVSGGPDSTALLLLLARLQSRLEVDLSVAHFNHMLRSRQEAEADLSFVRSLASEFAIPVVDGRGAVGRHAKQQHLSLEESARNLRYSFLKKAAIAIGKERLVSQPTVAAGHTMDDQAETVLLHLLRGSGLTGLGAMEPRAFWPFHGPGPDLARPLLCLRRRETEGYCHDLGVTPRRDPTNETPIATRNRIRHRLLPVLREFNPRIDEALVRMAEAARSDERFIQSVVDDVWPSLADLGPNRISFPREQLATIHPVLIGRLIRTAYARLALAPGLEDDHIQKLVGSLSRPRFRISLPHKITATLNAQSLTFNKSQPRSAEPMPETPLAFPGRTTVGAWIIQTKLVAPPGNPRVASPLEAHLDADSLGGALTVRSRGKGDRLRPLGLGGEKKVQDIFVDAKIPAAERNSVPIVCSPAGIAWVAGHCIDERYALTPHCRQALHIRFTPLKADG